MAVLLPDKISTMGAGGYYLIDSKDVEYDNKGTPISLQEFLDNLEAGGVNFDDWVAQTEYKVDDLVVYENVLYKCLVEHTSGTDFSKVDEADETLIIWEAVIGLPTEELGEIFLTEEEMNNLLDEMFAEGRTLPDEVYTTNVEMIALLDKVFKGIVTHTYSILTSDGKELLDSNGKQIVYKQTTTI